MAEALMHCPNCGAQAPTDQKFCRSCGFDLKLVSQLVAGTAEVSADDRLRKTMTKWIVGAFSVIVSAALALIFLPLGGAGGFGLGLPELGVLLLVLAAIFAFPAFIALLVVWIRRPARDPLPPQSRKLPEQQPAAQAGKTTDKLLVEPSLEPVTSITEDTTRQLEEAKRQNRS